MIKILKRGEVKDSEIFARTVPAADVGDTVAAIIEDVKKNGDEALFRYTERFDGVRLESLELSREEADAAVASLDPAFMDILEEAASNIRRFHENQKRSGFTICGDGIVLGQKITAVERAGLYVPGGTAAYPSTVLMDAIPARIAGVDELVITTPCGRDGRLPAAIVGAARVAGVDRIFKIGGAQAIAALAYGTETVPAVDKIVGPGNAYVAEAKRQVSGTVGIDMIAGPSEIMVIADGKNDPSVVAADLLSQAEHDRLASAVLVTDSMELAERVAAEIETRLADLPRREIASASIENCGKIIVTDSLDEAFAIAARIAPEHLEICLDEPFRYLAKVRNAGSVFLGRSCPEALGDYMAGPNHTLPTMGSARFASPLSVDDFIKKTQYPYYSPEALSRVAGKIAAFAEAEGLSGHARSVLSRK